MRSGDTAPSNPLTQRSPRLPDCLDRHRPNDQWLHAVRLTKTRSDAAAACRGGHVKINGKPAKPSSPVKVEDRVEALIHQRQRVVDVARLITKRVGAAIAVECYEDHSPPPPDAITSVPCSPSATGVPIARPTATAARSTASAAAAPEHK